MRAVIACAAAVCLFLCLGWTEWSYTDPPGVVHLGYNEVSGGDYLDVYSGIDVANLVSIRFTFTVSPDSALGAGQVLKAQMLSSDGVPQNPISDTNRESVGIPSTCTDGTGLQLQDNGNKSFKLQATASQQVNDATTPATGEMICWNLTAGPRCVSRFTWYAANLTARCHMVAAHSYPTAFTGGAVGLRLMWPQTTDPYTYNAMSGEVNAYGVLRQY